MVSVTSRIKTYKQPYGGFLKVKEFTSQRFDDGNILNREENVHATVVGQATEYLFEVMMGIDKKEVFRVSLQGAFKVEPLVDYKMYLENIQGLDDISIINTCKLSSYDVAFRAGLHMYKSLDEDLIDSKTIENIRIMVKRSLEFFEDNGPIIACGMNFEGAYTDEINTGDADILTESGLWDMKVSKSPITNKHTLQVLIYYLMGRNSNNSTQYEKVEKIGLFNPRLNVAYYKNIEDISQEVIERVEKEVIGY